jgi:ubiquinone/menaquinone biosynthesis C-methylase UbiE
MDNSEEQLKTARALQAEHGLEFRLIHGNAEAVPLPDASFDLAISEYGVSIWADPSDGSLRHPACCNTTAVLEQVFSPRHHA